MMYEELVQRLRRYVEIERSEHHGAELEADAADAIEELLPFKKQVEKGMRLLDKADELLNAIKPRWVSVTERLLEESDGLNWHDDMMIRFVSVWCCDVNTGNIAVRNRLQGKKTGIEYLDRHTKDTNWQWSDALWEPTHWMPIVPLPEPPKEANNG